MLLLCNNTIAILNTGFYSGKFITNKQTESIDTESIDAESNIDKQNRQSLISKEEDEDKPEVNYDNEID